MLEASRNASRVADTIEYPIFAHASGIAFNRVLQLIIEVLQVQLNTCFESNNRIRALQSKKESCLKIRVLQSTNTFSLSRFAVIGITLNGDPYIYKYIYIYM